MKNDKKKNMNKEPSNAPPELDEGKKAKLEIILQNLNEQEGTVTRTVFARGDCFIKAREITGKYFPSWLKDATHYSIRMAYNYAEISAELGPQRKRYIEVCAGVAQMTELLTASDAVRETVLERLAEHQRVTVAMIKTMKLAELGLAPAKPSPACETPGAAGLRRLADEKLKATIGKFLIAVANLVDGIERLAAQARLGKTMQRRDLLVLVVTPAKLAKAYLIHLALPLVEEQRTVTPSGFKAGSLWSDIDEMIALLASESDLSKVDHLLEYLREESHPLLSSVLDPGSPVPATRTIVETPTLAPDDIDVGDEVSEATSQAEPAIEPTEDVDEGPDASEPEIA
jgi:hypothetical protein